jgi:hypothetical protein
LPFACSAFAGAADLNALERISSKRPAFAGRFSAGWTRLDIENAKKLFSPRNSGTETRFNTMCAAMFAGTMWSAAHLERV